MDAIPIPTTLLELTWAIIGALFARAFGKQLDKKITASAWFKARHPFWRLLLGGTLNFTHHLWIGLLIMLSYPIASSDVTTAVAITFALPGGGLLPVVPYWFGYGLFLDDLPDVPARFKKYFEYIEKAQVPATT